MKVLISAPHLIPDIDKYRHLFLVKNNPFLPKDIEIVIPKVDERLSEEELLQLNIEEFDGILCGDDALTERVVKQAHKLQVISKWGTGIDSIDQDACAQLDIKVCNVTNVFTNAVADTTMGYILIFARRLFDANKNMHNLQWCKLRGVALHETTLGVVGVGNIGKAVVRRAKCFGMALLGNDLIPMPDEFLDETGIEMVNLHDLCVRADFITLHCNLNLTSHHLIGEREFGLMKPTSYLINTSRGPVIDEQALIAAMWRQQISGVALDVFEDEPLPAGSMLRTLPHILLGPHNANTSPSAKETTHVRSIRNLLDNLS